MTTRPQISRRSFTLGLGGSGVLALAGCGGGGDEAPTPALVPTPGPAPTSAPTPAPPSVTGISLVAGGLGGVGMLDGFGGDARITSPGFVASTPEGGVWFLDGQMKAVRVSAGGVVEHRGVTLAPQQGGEQPSGPGGIAVDANGVLYLSDTNTGVIYKFIDGSNPAFVPFVGQRATFLFGGFHPRNLAYDGQNHLWFADGGGKAVCRVSLQGEVTTIAGGSANTTRIDGTGAAAGFADPQGIVRMPDGNFVVADAGQWRRVTPQGVVTTLAGTYPSDIALHSLVAAGTDAVYALRGNTIVRVGLDGTVTLVSDGGSEPFDGPSGLTMVPGGDLVVSDTGNHVLRRIVPATGQTTARAGAAPQAGLVDGTGAAARFAGSTAATTDPAGNLYVIGVENRTLRKVTPAGAVTTLIQNFPSEGGVAIDAAGNFYGVRDRAIVRVTPAGVQSVFAGQPGVLGFQDGLGAQASFARPLGLAFDAQGNLYVGDTPDFTPRNPFITSRPRWRFGNTIRKITPAGVVSTFAGIAGREYDYEPGFDPAPDPANTFACSVLAVDGNGNLLAMEAGRLASLRWVAADGKPVADIGRIRRFASSGGAPTVLVESAPQTEVFAGMAVEASGAISFVRHGHSNNGEQAIIVQRLDANGTVTDVAGQKRVFRQGVRLGALPGALNVVTALAPAPEGALYALSENSVLKIRTA